MSLTTCKQKDRHLSVVADDLAADTADLKRGFQNVFRLAVNAAVGPPLDEQVSAAVLDHLAGLDGDNGTARDVLDLAAADVGRARQELTEAARRLALRSAGRGRGSWPTKPTGLSLLPAKPPGLCSPLVATGAGRDHPRGAHAPTAGGRSG
jgi:hypothetical protein